MFSFVPYYNLISKFFHHLGLNFEGLNRFSLNRSFNFCRKKVEGIDLFNNLDIIFGDQANALCSSITESDSTRILGDADLSLKHIYNILGSGPRELKDIVWNYDFKTSFQWPTQKYHSKQARITPCGSDIKMPWEFSRCHHLLWLAEAYALTKDTKYANEVIAEILDWIDKNPLYYGVNWTCSMDVAIRAVNWMSALNFINSSDYVPLSIQKRIAASLYQHGVYIYTHLEKIFPYSNNHYASDIVGLLYLGRLFYQKEFGRKWYKLAYEEYCREIRYQVLPSGVHFEKSISYHRLMTELLGYSYSMLIRVGEVIPEDIRYRVKSMYQFVDSYLKPNGFAPQVGDNDNGRFLPFVRRDFRLHDYLTDADSLDNQIVWNNVGNAFYNLMFHSEGGKKAFEDAGFVIMKNDEAYIFISNTASDKYVSGLTSYGGHRHNDELSFELNVKGVDLIVDPGAYIYTANIDKHKEYRSTKKHNTIVVDGEEQNIIDSLKAFMFRNNTITDYLFVSGDNMTEGAYHTKEGKLYHLRKFMLHSSYLHIHDELKKQGKSHRYEMYFHLSQKYEIKSDGDTLIIGDLYKISFDTSLDKTIEIFDDHISPSYGIEIESLTIRVSGSFNEEGMIDTIVSWN